MGHAAGDLPLVSVIMPAYNCADYIEQSIRSVLEQSYSNFEIVITDDASTDNTVDVIRSMIREDGRIRLYSLEKNSGAAIARNNSVTQAQGEFLAFLDSDDIWTRDKLEKQIGVMREKGYAFTCTSYGKIDSQGNRQNKVVTCKDKYDYKGILKDCPGNSTIIYNCASLGKVYGPDIRRRNDFALWLQVIKKAEVCHGISEILGYHRVREGSISVNKRKLVRYQWDVYRKIEHLGFFRSAYYLTGKIVKGILNKNG